MKLSTRSRYGLRAMVDLATNGSEGSVLLKDIAYRQRLSLKYLEQLITPLRAAGLVRGSRGAHGGYVLAKAPEEIHLDEIVQALEGVQTLTGCSRLDDTCDMNPVCATHEVLVEIYESVMAILRAKTLHDLVKRQRQLVQIAPCQQDPRTRIPIAFLHDAGHAD